MATYETDEEQLEAIKKWWQQHGKAVLIGVVIGFGLLGGWRWWQIYTEQQAHEASNLYEQMQLELEQKKMEPAHKMADKLLSDHSTSPYAVLAALSLARQDVEDESIDSSHARLQWVIEQNSSLTELTHIARLRKTRLFLSQEQLAEAKSLINGIDVGQFNGAYAELRGDIAIAEGQIDVARRAYKEALGSDDLSAPQSQWLQMKLDDLGLAAAERIEVGPPLSAMGHPSTAQESALTVPVESTTATSKAEEEATKEQSPATLPVTTESSTADSPLTVQVESTAAPTDAEDATDTAPTDAEDATDTAPTDAEDATDTAPTDAEDATTAPVATDEPTDTAPTDAEDAATAPAATDEPTDTAPVETTTAPTEAEDAATAPAATDEPTDTAPVETTTAPTEAEDAATAPAATDEPTDTAPVETTTAPTEAEDAATETTTAPTDAEDAATAPTATEEPTDSAPTAQSTTDTATAPAESNNGDTD